MTDFTIRDAAHSSIVIRSESLCDLVTISLTDGSVEFGKDYDPDEAARIFWDGLAAYFPRWVEER